MATAVILDGAMGKAFGKKWDLHISSPAEALRMIEANKPGLAFWVRDNLAEFEGYSVTCTYKNGVVESIGEDEMTMDGELESIRFTPVVAGSGNIAKIIAGVVIIALVTFFTWGAGTAPAAGGLSGFFGAVGGSSFASGAMLMGAGLVVGGIVGMMTPQPQVSNLDNTERKDRTSYYFNGPVNTVTQGVPVPLIYGKCLVGSHAVSVSLTVDEEKK